MFNFRHVSLLAACYFFTSCGTVGYGGDDGPTEEGRLFGDYLAGSYAENLYDASARSSYYSSAFSRAPDDTQLGSKAITAALADDNQALAKTLSIEMSAIDQSDAMSRLVLGASDMANGNYAKAAQYLAEQPDNPAIGVMIAFLEGWAEFGAGDIEEALEIFSSIETDGYFNIISTLQKANIYAQIGDEAKALEAYDKVQQSGLARVQTLLSKARFLSSIGRNDEALNALLDFDTEMGGVETGPIRSAINTLESGGILDTKLTPAEHAANSLIEPAGAIFAQQRAYGMSETYLRTALILDENNQNVRLWLGNVLERMERPSDAELVYKSIPKSSDYSVSAQLSYSNLLFRDDNDDEAVKILSALYADNPALITREALGTAYLIKEDYALALPIYDALVSASTDEQLALDTRPLFNRGVCLEQLDRWDEAELDFKRALEINPESADVLNYLGYTWVDRGVNLNEAFDMIRKAVKLEPESGAIIDSLGWAHFKLGQYSQARIHLEEASEKSPGSATIIDHLGDVYWKLGRFLEAGYQWERALDLDPTDKEIAKIKAKLEGGYEAARDLP